MMVQGFDERGEPRRKTGLGGSERTDAPEISIDWGQLHAEVLVMFDRAGLYKFERAIGGASVADAVQTIIAELYEQFEAGEGPRTHEDLKVLAAVGVRKKLYAWRQRESRHTKQLAAHAATFTTGNLFELICRRDENAKFFARMYEEVERDPDAKMLLIMVLEKEFSFKQTRVLAEVMGYPKEYVTSIKRRLVRLGGKILEELNGSNPNGGGE